MSQQFTKTFNRKKRYRRRRGRGLNRKQKAQVKKLIEIPKELKFYDTSFNAIALDFAPLFVDMTAPAQGDGMDMRNGSRIWLKSVQYAFNFQLGDNTNYFRFLILQWFLDNGHDQPQWQQIFQFHTGGLPINQLELMSPYVLDEGGTHNFRILLDKQFYLDLDNPIQTVKGYLNKGFRKSLECSGAEENGTNHIFAMMISDSGAVSHPTVSGYTRARFYDS